MKKDKAVEQAWNQLGHAHALRRALEVSLAGRGIRTMVIGHSENGQAQLDLVRVSLFAPPPWGWVTPCPCGNLGSFARGCYCDPTAVEDWRRKFPEADICVEVPWPDHSDIGKKFHAHEELGAVLERAGRAREVYEKLSAKGVEALLESALKFLSNAAQRLAFTLDQRERVLRVSAAVAALDGEEAVKVHHVAEAIQYRQIGGKFNTERKELGDAQG